MGLPMPKGMCAGGTVDLDSGLDGQDTEGLFGSSSEQHMPAME